MLLGGGEIVNNNPTKTAARREIKRRLIHGLFGTYLEWVDALIEARDAGWTLNEVRWIVRIYHPWTWIIVACIGLLVAGIVIGR